MGINHQGFTLMELIASIVIISILTAVVVPRFIDVKESARKAAFEDLKAQITAAAYMARAKQHAEGKSPDESIVVDGKTIAMGGGFPTDSSMRHLLIVRGFKTSAAGWFQWKDAKVVGLYCAVDYNGVGQTAVDKHLFSLRTRVANC